MILSAESSGHGSWSVWIRSLMQVTAPRVPVRLRWRCLNQALRYKQDISLNVGKALPEGNIAAGKLWGPKCREHLRINIWLEPETHHRPWWQGLAHGRSWMSDAADALCSKYDLLFLGSMSGAVLLYWMPTALYARTPERIPSPPGLFASEVKSTVCFMTEPVPISFLMPYADFLTAYL